MTIGQAPRDDVVPDMEAVLGPSVQFVQYGALDGMDVQAIRALRPQDGDVVLATRLRDGREVRLAHDRVTPLLRRAMNRACEESAELAVILCTGTFDKGEIGGDIPIMNADVVLTHTVAALAADRNLLIVCPDRNQVQDMEARWGTIAPRAHVVAASPYGPRDAFKEIIKGVAGASELQPQHWLAVLDCVGYDLEHQRALSQITPLSSVIPRLAIAHLLSQTT